jgi:outer membrane cobalamin receptor
MFRLRAGQPLCQGHGKAETAVPTCEPGYLATGLEPPDARASARPEGRAYDRAKAGTVNLLRRVSTPERSLVARRFVRLILPVLSLFLCASTADAATITGRVVDPDGRAVPGATVLFVADGEPLRTTTTDTRGEFTIEMAADLPFEVRIALAGFRTEIRRLDRGAAGALGEIRLSVGAISEGVIVSAAQVEIPLSEAASSVTVLTAADLEARQVRSVADALRSVPGLTVAGTGGLGSVTAVFPRGGESNFTLVMVDDVPVNAFGGEYDFGNLATENVERIEIVRGPQSALFGSNAIGSVVRVITRRGGPPAVSGTFEGGTDDTYRTAASSAGTAGRFDWGISGERLTSDGLNGRQSPHGLTVENDDYARASGSLVAGWRLGGAQLRAQVRQDNDERGVPGPYGSNPIGAYTAIDTVSRSDNTQTTAGLSAAVPLTSRVRSVVQFGYHRLASDFDSPFGASESGSRRISGRAQVDVSVARPLEMTAGLELQSERASSTFITDPSFTPVPVERRLAGYFTELRWNRDRRLLVTGGVRVDDIDRQPLAGAASEEDRVLSVNPRLAVSWLAHPEVSSSTKLRASAATGIRPPGAFEIAFTTNPSLKPERSVSGEAGIEQAFAGGRARVDAAVFYNRYDDLIVAVGSFSGSSRYTTDNISNARAGGLEIGLDTGHRLFTARPVDLHARVAYTFIDSEVLAVDQEDEAPPPFTVGEPLLRRPRHQFSAELTARSGPLTAFVSGRSRGRALDVEPSLGTFGGLFYADGFTVWNGGASYRVGRIGELFGRVENLFDRGYEESLGFPAPGRRATIGLRVAASR